MTRTQLVQAVGAALAALLIFLGFKVLPDSPTPTPPTTTTTSSMTTTTVVPGLVQTTRVPVDQLTVDPNSAQLAAALVRPGAFAPQFGQQPAGSNYAISVVDARTANTTRRVWRKQGLPGAFLAQLQGTLVPWNDAWRPPDGNDQFMVIFNPDSGAEIDTWNVSTPTYSTLQNTAWGCAFTPGFDVNSDLCAASYLPITLPDGSTADVRTSTANSPYASGGGLPNMWGLLGPQDISNERCQAIKTMATNTSKGPTGQPAVAPAGQWERSDGGTHGAQQTFSDVDSIPEGTRLSLRMTETEQTAWLDARGFTGAKRAFAAHLVHCLVRTGIIISDTLGYGGPALQFAWDYLHPNAYRDLGVDGTGADLFTGLDKASLWTAWAPPTNRCVDGRVTSLWCWASGSTYTR